MTGGHRALRILAVALAGSAAGWSLRQPSATDIPPREVRLVAPAAPQVLSTRQLFAPASPIDAAGVVERAGAPPELIGIVGRLPGAAEAMLRLGDGTTHGVPIGGVAEGWRIVAIGADRVRLTRAGHDHVEVLPPVD